MIEIAPSILSADFSCLREQVDAALQTGVKRIHFDIMDGHFVPNITFGPRMVGALAGIIRQFGALAEVHLMITEPERYIEDFVDAGGDVILVHVETCPHLHRTLQAIHDAGAAAGVVLNPASPITLLAEILPYTDQILLMTVNPGFGGQQFIPLMLEKIRALRETLDKRGLGSIPIEVDGGIHTQTISQVQKAGARIAVAGSAVFNQQRSIAENIAALSNACKLTV